MDGHHQMPHPHPQMQMPGQQYRPQPQPQYMPGNPMPGNPMPGNPMPGNPMQGLPFQMTFPYYLGFSLVPVTLPDGKQNWTGIVPQQIHKSQAEFAEIIKKDKENKIKVGEMYQNASLNGEKRRQVDRILNDHQRAERDPNLEWKLASIKLTGVELANGLAKIFISKPQVNKIRVILKKVLRSPPKAGRRQSVSLPFNPMVMHQQPGMAAFQNQNFQQRPQAHPGQAHLYGEVPPPPPPLNPGGHGGRPAQVLLNRSPAPGGWSDREPSRAFDDRGSGRGNKGDRSASPRSPKIRVPEVHDRRGSKTSSRLTYNSNDSELFSVGESPITSRSNSPKHWPESRRHSGHSKKYHSKKGSDYSKRDRRLSLDSDDSFVIVDGHRKHGSPSSHGSRSIERWSRGIIPASRRRNSYRRDSIHRDESDQRALERQLQKLRVADLERQEEDRLDMEHTLDMNDRLNRLERNNVVHQDHGRYGRPSLDRARSDRGAIGYVSRPRFGGSATLWD